MVCSTVGKASGYVKFARAAVWSGNIATPGAIEYAAIDRAVVYWRASAQGPNTKAAGEVNRSKGAV